MVKMCIYTEFCIKGYMYSMYYEHNYTYIYFEESVEHIHFVESMIYDTNHYNFCIVAFSIIVILQILLLKAFILFYSSKVFTFNFKMFHFSNEIVFSNPLLIIFVFVMIHEINVKTKP